MEFEPPPDLNSELLNEFFSEADEHLAEIRRCLAALDDYTESAQVDRTVAEALFRSFHSFKGNSAIVGLGTAESVAHAAEEYLRQLVRGQVTLTVGTLDVLMMAAQHLEQTVQACRHKESIPAEGAMLARLRGLLQGPARVAPGPVSSGTDPGLPKADLATLIENARGRGLVLCTAVFVPNKALDERGVNVTSIRARLAELGQILSGTPQVRSKGSIAFEFLLALREVPPDLTAWEADGLTLQLRAEVSGEPPLDPAGPALAAPEVPVAHSPFIAPSHVVRVDLSRLDELMRIAGDLIIHRAHLEDHIQSAASRGQNVGTRGFQEVNLALSRSLRDLRDAIMRVRLVPLAEVFQRIPFVVRDLARERGLRAKLAISGQETEIDKYLIESLKDPLLHLVRNAVSHGIESPEERLAHGKLAEATITLSASTVGDSVIIEIGDDGRGVDARRVAERAAAQGLAVPDPLDQSALLKLLCAPGFSTRDEADRASGRGVGMAVVDRTMHDLGGTLRLDSQLGRGTRFFLQLPLTLAIADVFVVKTGDQTFAVPQALVQEIVELCPDRIQQVNQAELLAYRGAVLPLLRMTALLGLPASQRLHQPVLVLSAQGQTTGLVVDRIMGQREVVVRAMRDPLVQTPGIAGATELGDGRPVLILDTAALASGRACPVERMAPTAAGLALAG